MFVEAYKRAFGVLKSKPIRLWGLSLLVGVISIVSVLFSLWFLPVGIAFCMVIECGMAKVYLDGLKGKEVNTDQIFEGCKSGKAFFRIAGGMAWRSLWEFIWSLVAVVAYFFGMTPVIFSVSSLGRMLTHSYSYGYDYGFGSVATLGSAVLWLVVVVLGIIPGIYKSYQYRFVPYILITRSDVNATAALRLSKEMTKGKKGQMFLADIVLGAGVAVVMLVLSLFGAIPVIGELFRFLAVVVNIIYGLFAPIFLGLSRAAFYEEVPAQAAIPEDTTANSENL